MKKLVAIVLAMVILLSSVDITKVHAIDNGVNDKMRGVWVATVLNIDYPKEPTTNSLSLKAEAIRILDEVKAMNMNAVFLQVRPTADALYPSDIFSYSKYLTGSRELKPDNGFDPLQFWVEEAHKRGIELHAWINPYRITKNEKNKPQETMETLPADHVARLNSQYVVKFGEDLYFDPGIPEVRTLIASGVEEILRKYQVDGIHFDDYFYPAASFNDSASFKKYGNGASLTSWRIDNVNKMVQEVHKVSQKYNKPFGIAPFGIWRNKSSDPKGSNTKGGETYSMHYADCRAWVKNGWVDYIMPQIYWEFGHSAADYKTLVDWWSDVVKGTNVKLYIGQAAYKATQKNESDKWYGADQLIRQVEYSLNKENISGNVFFSLRSFKNNPLMARGLTKYYTDKLSITGDKGNSSVNNSSSTNNDSSTDVSSQNTNPSSNTNSSGSINLFDTPAPGSSNQSNAGNSNSGSNSSNAYDSQISANTGFVDPNSPSKSIGKKMPDSNRIMGFEVGLEVDSHKFGDTISKKNTVLEGKYDSKLPLILNGEKITSTGYNKFRIPVTLEDGANYFVFTNGPQSLTLVLNHNANNNILANAYPSATTMINAKEFEVSVSAIAGSDVSAVVAGKTYSLSPASQIDLTKPNLQKVKYSKKLTFEEVGTNDVGIIEYKANTGSKTFSLFSGGSMINLNNNSKYYAMVQDDESDVYFKNDSSQGSAHILAKGDIDRIVYMAGRYAKLGSGYWIRRSNISWFYQEENIATQIAYRNFADLGDWKRIDFSSSKQSAVYLDYIDKDDTLRLYVPLAESLPVLPNFPEHFKIKSVSTKNEQNSYYEFSFHSQIDGYFIQKTPEGFALFLKPHKKSEDAKYPLKDKVIMIDPGHGGDDSGTKGHRPDVIMEKGYTLQTSYKLKRYLENLGATVYMTRYQDDDVYMYDRLRSGHRVNADLFISIHANAVGNKRASVVKGFSAYIQHGNNLSLVKSIRDHMVKNLGMNDMKVHMDDFYVTRGTQGLYMLLEMGFLTHPEEYKNLANPDFQEKQAAQIAKALVQYYSK